MRGLLELVSTTVASAATAVATTSVAISVSAAAAAATVASAASAITAVTSSVASGSSGATATSFGCAVNLDCTTVELGFVQATDGLVGIVGTRIGDESETAAATSFAVADNDGVFNLTIFLKLASQGIVVCGPGQTADEKFNRHNFELAHGMGV
jgi:hypothetical protein